MAKQIILAWILILIIVPMAFSSEDSIGIDDFNFTEVSELPLSLNSEEIFQSFIVSKEVINGNIYIIGGYIGKNGSSYIGSKHVYRYSISDNSWYDLGEILPFGILSSNTQAVYFDNNLYWPPTFATGNSNGWGSHKSILKMNLNSNHVEEIVDLKSSYIWSVGIEKYLDNIYFFGGHNGSDNSHIFAYNPNINVVEQKINMNTSRGQARAVEMNGKIYIFGCRQLSQANLIEEFDPVTNSIVAMNSSFEFNNTGYTYILCPWKSNDNKNIFILSDEDDSFWVFNPEKDSLNNVGVLPYDRFSTGSYDPATGDYFIFVPTTDNRYTKVVRISYKNSACYTQSDLDAKYDDGYEKGKQYCKSNPAACGIVIGGDTQAAYDEGHSDAIAEVKADPTAYGLYESCNSCCNGGDGTDNCAILESDFDITMPCIDVFGTRLPIGLERFTYPGDPFGYYWKLNLQ